MRGLNSKTVKFRLVQTEEGKFDVQVKGLLGFEDFFENGLDYICDKAMKVKSSKEAVEKLQSYNKKNPNLVTIIEYPTLIIHS